MKRIFSIAVLLASASLILHTASAQDRILTPGVRMLLAGPYFGANYNMHTGYFSTAQGALTCCEFDGGEGIGMVGGIKAFIPIARKWFISPRIGFESLDGDFDATPQQYPILGIDNTMEMATLDNKLEASLQTASVDIHAVYIVAPFGLYITAGPSAAIIAFADYTKTERISDPPGVRYLDGSTEKLLYSGDLELTEGAVFFIRGGVGALIPLTTSLYFNPEVLYGYPLTKLSKLHEWKVGTVQLTLGALFIL